MERIKKIIIITTTIIIIIINKMESIMVSCTVYPQSGNEIVPTHPLCK